MVDEDKPIDEDVIRGANGKPFYANNGGGGNAAAGNNVDNDNDKTVKTANAATDNTGSPKGYSESHVFEETFRKANPNPALTDEERKKKEKQEKAEKLENFFGKVGNLVSGLSNLYFTTKYAPSAYQKQSDDTKQLNDKWERYWLDEEAKKKAWARDLGTAVAKDVDNNNKQRQWWANMEQKQKESQRKEQIANAQIGRLQALQEGDKAKAKYWEARERALADGLDIDAAEAQAKAEYYRALGRKADAAADKVRNEIGGGTGNRYYGEYGGKRYATKADYDKAVLEDARRRGVKIRQTVGGIEVDGKVYDAKEVDRAIADIAGEMSYQDSQRQTQTQVGSTKQPAKPQRNTNSGATQQPAQSRDKLDNNVLKGFSIHK